MGEMTVEDPEVAMILAAEAEAMQIAQAHIGRFAPFAMLPDEVSLRLLADYRKVLASRGISRSEAETMIQSDMARVAVQLRGLTAGLLYIGSVRHGVLFHVALLIGIDALRNMPGLWEALRSKSFEDASEALMMSNWPAVVGSEADEKRRVLDLQRMMRTGLAVPERSSRAH